MSGVTDTLVFRKHLQKTFYSTMSDTGLIYPTNMPSDQAMVFFTTRDKDISVSGLSSYIGPTESRIYLPVQKHTDEICIVNKDTPKGRVCDAVVTAAAGMLIGVVTADCVPVLILDPEKGVAGAVHAGWRGSASGILKKTLQLMQDEFSSKPADMMLAVGPAIGGCCYNVGKEVADQVLDACGGDCTGEIMKNTQSGLKLDLAHANKCQALEMRVPDGNIWMAGRCTRCEETSFYSFRRDGNGGGRQGGFIMII